VVDYLGDCLGLDIISCEELVCWVCDGDVVVLDVRFELEYCVGYIVGVIFVLIGEIICRLCDIFKDC